MAVKISELSAALGFSKTEQDKIDSVVENRSLSRCLTVMRVKSGLTQTEMAKKIGISQSNISKLEHSSNDQITITDVAKYVQALGYELKLTIGKPKPLTEQIIHTHQHMIDLCQKLERTERDDKNILEGLADFERVAAENMVNLAAMFLKCSKSKYNKLHRHTHPEICVEEEFDDFRSISKSSICSDI